MPPLNYNAKVGSASYNQIVNECHTTLVVIWNSFYVFKLSSTSIEIRR